MKNNPRIKPLVTKQGNELLVEDEGTILLAFIDMMNKQGFSYMIQGHPNGMVKLGIYSVDTGPIEIGPCSSFKEAKDKLSAKLIQTAMKGAAQG